MLPSWVPFSSFLPWGKIVTILHLVSTILVCTCNHINSFSPSNNSFKKMLSPWYRWGNWGPRISVFAHDHTANRWKSWGSKPVCSCLNQCSSYCSLQLVLFCVSPEDCKASPQLNHFTSLDLDSWALLSDSLLEQFPKFCFLVCKAQVWTQMGRHKNGRIITHIILYYTHVAILFIFQHTASTWLPSWGLTLPPIFHWSHAMQGGICEVFFKTPPWILTICFIAIILKKGF